MRQASSNDTTLPIVVIFMVLATGLLVAYMGIEAMFGDPEPAETRAEITMPLELEPTTVVIPGSETHTKVVIEMKGLPVNKDAPTFSDVLAEKECENRTARSKEACIARSKQQNALVHSDPLAARHCKGKAGRALEACMSQAAKCRARAGADANKICFK